MPALAITGGAQAPRAPDSSSLTAREPATDFTANAPYSPYNAVNPRSLESRQIVQGLIPTYYRNDGPGAGAVVGIVLGSVVGFLLLVWLFWSLTNNNRNAIAGEEEIVVRRPRRNSHAHRSRRGSRSEVREVVREYDRSPRRSGGRSAVIVEERNRPRPRSIVVEERSRVPGDDVVEVIEEHDQYRERRRRGSGYR
ncbi:hypothetical protein BU23DRAFT_523407 [Bimuria novae-zelandiae CBS 107.79]|uniref:Uncharacterized protein n=1 Tax=Bimuria novae-zelandiae CBS 107.79 TaxID=1447943 RepID=A0A6A5VY79_9PLEO|nr:hypothetical protein BU23DRAFT_523407 [Bimuria novae-zelandiae CBS 107.79]